MFQSSLFAYFFISSMFFVIVLTVSDASCIFSIPISSLWSIFYYHYSEFSFREITYFLFVYLVLWVSTLLFHLCCISSLSFLSFFSNLLYLRSPFPRLYSCISSSFWFFPLEGKVGWVVCVDFLLVVTCACVLVGTDQAGNYRNTGTYTHTLPPDIQL